MAILHCTRKLLARLPQMPALDPERPIGRLGNWYATLIVTRPAQLVLLVNEATRLPVLLPGREFATLTARIPAAVAEVLVELGVDREVLAQEDAALRWIALAPTANRSVVGTMNDFIFQLAWIRQHAPNLSLRQLSLQLAETPVGPLDYQHPAAATTKLLS